MLHVPVPAALIAPMQLLTPSETVTLPVGTVGLLLPGALTARLKLTVKDCPVTVGSGVSLVMVEVVSALLMVKLAVATALSTVASAAPAPAAEARKVAVAVPLPAPEV